MSLTFDLLAAQRRVVVLLLPQAPAPPLRALLPPLRLQTELQLCQSAVELQVQAQSSRSHLTRKRFPRQETSVRDQRRAGRGQRGERGARGERAHGARSLRQSERLDPGRPRLHPHASPRPAGVSRFPIGPLGVSAAAARHYLVFVDGGDGAGGPVSARAALLQEAVQLVLEVRVGEFGLIQVKVGEAEGGGGAQAGGGRQGAAAGGQRAAAAAGRAGQRARRQTEGRKDET